jgi:hypothetical protein
VHIENKGAGIEMHALPVGAIVADLWNVCTDIDNVLTLMW